MTTKPGLVDAWQLTKKFLVRAGEDPRISAFDISVYISLVHYCESRDCKNPFYIFSWQIMPQAKISSSSTYHRCMRHLNEYGYIQYIASYDHFSGSEVFFLNIL